MLLKPLLFIAALILGCSSAAATTCDNIVSDFDSFPEDPYLLARPAYSFSLPVQILLTGVIITLVTVLLIHLLFTAQYHWPLARLNYALQFSGVCILEVSLCSGLFVILQDAHDRSKEWPYMFDYISVKLPPKGWDEMSVVWWYIMEACTSGLAHITHIHFLTLLYPSALEARLIFLMLGPLAVASSASSFIEMTEPEDIRDLGDAIRNVCNSTLSLLFTIALFLWGFIHRDRAWRTDGGTAVFGAAALCLALFSTAMNFLQIPAEMQLMWLPGLMWATVLWQSFLGWWWWVGSGVGVVNTTGKSRRKGHSRKAVPKDANSSNTSRLSRWRHGVASAGDSLRQRHRRPSDQASIEVVSHGGSVIVSPAPTIPTPSNPPTIMDRWFATAPGRTMHRFWQRLRHAHEIAMRAQALEQAQSTPAPAGWGLGSFGLRQRDEARRRAQEAEDDESDLSIHELEGGIPGAQPRSSQQSQEPPSTARTPTRENSWWSWSNQVQRWRLKDRTVY